VSVLGKCRLCLREHRELQNSHFMSAAIHKVCRSRNIEPIALDGRSLRPTHGQMVDRLLCSFCEQRFTQRGEDWTIKNMARRSEFPIQNCLKRAKAMQTHREFAAQSIPGVDTDKLAYFAISIFWRASVHQWFDSEANQPIETISLGKYKEPLRRFLIDGATWPTDVLLFISIWPWPNPPLTFQVPSHKERNGLKSFQFRIPGLTFDLTPRSIAPVNLGREYPDSVIFIETTKIWFPANWKSRVATWMPWKHCK
jgi:hypothetical protein